MKYLITAWLCFWAVMLRADSPLTSTPFAQAYAHVTAIKNVLDKKVRIPGDEEFAFLDNTTVPLDQKIALINALGWGDSARFDVYKQHISKKYEVALATIDSILTFRGPQPTVFPGTEKITAEDLCCMAYFRAMTDYNHPMLSYYCAYLAVDKKPSSMTASYVYGLILAQVYLNLDWCRLYETMQAIKTFDGYATDSLSAQAIGNIHSYVDGYAEACKTADQKVEPEKPLYKKPEKRQALEKNKHVDLTVVEIGEPEYDDETKGTLVRVQILNAGNTVSIETNASLIDLDITVADAKKLGLKGDQLKVIKDNNEAAKLSDLGTYEGNPYLEEGVDYDQDFEVFQRIPVIKPGEIVTIVFSVKGYWVYDPNCELQLKIDLDDNIEEENEKNNTAYFVKWG